MTSLQDSIRQWAGELGFDDCGFSDTRLDAHEAWLLAWLANGHHGTMAYMERHGTKRSRPAELEPGTLSVISVRMDYYPPDAADAEAVLEDSTLGYVSRYALGRDYHKVMRKRLQKLATRIEQSVGAHGYRVFVDSAPVLEKALAQKAGLGWIGKHSNLLSSRAGSWFFLGEIYTTLPLAPDMSVEASAHCGTCTRCITACPTDAIISPYQVDARRCISYLTIEHHGSIPEEFRTAMGNRIYGCDDCQLVCPFNGFASPSREPDFGVRERLDNSSLVDLFAWSAEDFDTRLAGSPIRRIGHERWLRNIAVALGNAKPADDQTRQSIEAALSSRADDDSAIVREHVAWARRQQAIRLAAATTSA